MPTYEYLCEKCEHEFEREQRITEPPIKTCPECRARKVKKLISQTSFVLKGGGWYSDLYSSARANNGNGSAGDSSTSEPASSSKPEKSTGSSTVEKKEDGKKENGKKKTAA
jgi:putative FmdB family regulatory protein